MLRRSTQPSRRRRSLPPLAQNLLLALTTVLLVGAAAEGLARRLETGRPDTLHVADYITRWGEGENDFYTIKSTATGWPPWEDYNSEGVRDREHAVEKPPGVKRVVCLGDSVTLGTGLSAEDAYPQLLQDRLDAIGEPVGVLNIALGGWATRQERVAYQRIARKYRPDLVLLGVCLNDVPELHNNLARPPRPLGTLYLHSALVRWAVGARAREIHNIEELFQSPDTPKTRDAFRRFFAEVEGLQIDADAGALLSALASALTDGDSRVRAAAAHALGRLGPRAHAHLPVLMAATRDPEAPVRAAAARALGQIGPSADARALLTHLAEYDPDDGVRAGEGPPVLFRTNAHGLRAPRGPTRSPRA